MNEDLDRDEPADPPDEAQEDDAWFAPAASGDRTARPDEPRSARTWVLAGVGAAVIAAASVTGITLASRHSSASTPASAQFGPGGQAGPGGRPGGGGRPGAVVDVSGSTLTMRASTPGSSSTSTITVKTTSSTSITEAVTGTVSQIKTGDHLLISGTTSGTEVAATRIEDRGSAALSAGGIGGTPPGGAATGSGSSTQGPPTGPAPGGSSGSSTAGPPGFAGGIGGPPGMGETASPGGAPLMGTVTAVDGSTITVKSTTGASYTITAGSATTVTVDKTITLADLRAGEAVMVQGATSHGVITATTIRTAVAGFGPAGPAGQASGS